MKNSLVITLPAEMFEYDRVTFCMKLKSLRSFSFLEYTLHEHYLKQK